MTTKISFLDDYSELGHPRLLDALRDAAQETNATYGRDTYSQNAADMIRDQLKVPADIHFVSGGTQTNLLCLGSMLRPYESIISCDSGHINVHETGAIEATGHKIDAVPNQNGKLGIADIQRVLDNHLPEHCALPRVVFISQATELGSLYSRDELFGLSAFCRQKGLYLYLDGARLGSALTARDNQLTLADIAQCTDMFYIGGTKNGAPLGEAIVIPNEQLQENFRYAMKQRGAMLAKGSLLGVIFSTFFKDGLYWDIAKHANTMAQDLVTICQTAGLSFKATPQTNQIFPVLPDRVVSKLEENFLFYRWEKAPQDHTVIRLVTSWATRPESVATFGQSLQVALQTALPAAPL